MLTGDLLQFSRRSGRVHPRRVDPADARLRDAAEGLIGMFQARTGERRGDLEEDLAQFVPPGLDPKRVRGLARLLWERCTFEVAAAADPAKLREALFDASADEWRRFQESGTPKWRSALVERVAAGMGLQAAVADKAMYADLEENQIVTAFDPLPAERLLIRYNVAQVQGLLLRSDRVRIQAPWPAPQRLRQLLRWLKFFGLLFTVEESGTDPARAIVLTVDGPLSILEGPNRYGMNLAQFFPALLMWEGDWRLSAEVRLKGRGAADTLEVEPHPALRSHYPDHGQWVPDDVRTFVDAFNATPGPWLVEAADDVLLLPGNAFLVPDFRFRHTPSGRTLLMEHVLHPTPERIAALLQRGAASGERYTVAMRQFKTPSADPSVFTYRRTLTPAPVREWLNALSS
ncbi:MAG TPA: DUF790 family protein [bacterium]